MIWVSYRAISSKGRDVRGKIEAESIAMAIKSLRKEGLTPYETTIDSDEPEKWWNKDILEKSGLKRSELELFARELSTLINAQLPLDEALFSIYAMTEKSPVQGKAKAIREDVLKGDSFSESLRKQDIFADNYIGLIRAGEASGSLGPIMTQIADTIAEENKTRNDIRSALFYPILLMTLAVAALIFIITVLLPSLAPIFEDSGTEMPKLARFLLKLGEALTSNWYILLFSAGLLIASSIYVFKSSSFKSQRDILCLRLPIIGTLKRNIETSKFNRTLGMLLKNDVPLTQALSITQKSTTNSVFSQTAEDMNEAIKQGDSFNSTYSNANIFSPLAIRLITIGDRSGTLTDMITKSSDILDAQIKRHIERLVGLLTPILTLGTGALIGAIVLSVLSAILSVNDLAF